MRVIKRKSGEEFRLPSGLSVTVLEVAPCGVKFNIHKHDADERAPAETPLVSGLWCRAAGYYLFSQSGGCSFVVRCEKGQSVALNDWTAFRVVDVEPDRVTLQVAKPRP